MKRLIRKNNVKMRKFVIPTTPLYNPMGKGDYNSEFKEIDKKSYQQWFNQNTEEQYRQRGDKNEEIN